MNHSPISNRVGAIFIHVSNMQKSIQWYSELLGLPVQSASHEGTIYVLPMDGGTGVLLDSNMNDRKNTNDKTQFFFETKNLEESYKYIKNKGIEIVTEIEVHDDISFFTFKDPDENVLMVCEDKRKLLNSV
ncbi:VOC family protein [Cohnella lubricantis]|uniref:VOC family protein n=1 Tax=Cohnella lubricantis TaxID=2163172 RepID=A0A841TCS9_9BACL|nr:VOC family protein [Cohnella lubricantis]MBB6677809.1 VOC family protein [Cohnella lubricantis]MBP2120474.1 putative enzyme related to lactoylglutathione lyase [Cohnella lubricantis]